MPGPGAPDYNPGDTDAETLRKAWGVAPYDNALANAADEDLTPAGLALREIARGLSATKPSVRPSLPEDDASRGQYPMADGCLDYFPNAIAEVSRISYEGNQKHNPGQPMHWSRGKSTDHRNKILRHTVDSVLETEAGVEHAAQAAWRALAYLQEKIERVRGVPVSRGSRAEDRA